MLCRSYLFVPGDSSRKLEKSTASGADALILDLEDSVAPEAKASARDNVGAFLQNRCMPACYIRVNALAGEDAERDMAATASLQPDGYVLPKCEGPADIHALSRMIDRHGGGSKIRIMAIATETVRGVRSLMRDDWSHPRLAALTWGGEDLAADMGAFENRDEDNAYSSPFRMARDLTLFAALDAGLMPVDSVFTSFRDLDGLKRESDNACAIGFTGKMVIHPSQVAVVNTAFTPSESQIEWARQVIDIFSESNEGVATLSGKMLDAPHLRQAKRIVDIAKQASKACP